MRSNKENDGGRSSSGNWSASGSSCSTRGSLDSERHHHASPLAVRSQQRRVNQANRQESGKRSLSPEMDVDSALSGDDCSATTTATGSSGVSHSKNGDGHALDHDMETSSVYSCDAEGYYTSFHIDSGLKTLKVCLHWTLATSLSLFSPAFQRLSSLFIKRKKLFFKFTILLVNS